uniref:Uncharacterized protein n=1 Tax=Chromera velia CCMP2878 TaxID=1169474 RepID=A0A0G4HFD6_9ALVE|eukprot:Cvel_1004.t1-p1 / transcript=Cvel_1004.t1 / gene=Cvel_1004 / organism=Chromera_velia_CCMP2878 / gene_product=hypothetical protein / transcript_product=hypothetical protein / location=Cvel_scaffold32:150434-155931(+) / protein_length=850 / sequence_SO=supercontig / SO=protein_coding / is_pseudo=false
MSGGAYSVLQEAAKETSLSSKFKGMRNWSLPELHGAKQQPQANSSAHARGPSSHVRSSLPTAQPFMTNMSRGQGRTGGSPGREGGQEKEKGIPLLVDALRDVPDPREMAAHDRLRSTWGGGGGFWKGHGDERNMREPVSMRVRALEENKSDGSARGARQAEVAKWLNQGDNVYRPNDYALHSRKRENHSNATAQYSARLHHPASSGSPLKSPGRPRKQRSAPNGNTPKWERTGGGYKGPVYSSNEDDKEDLKAALDASRKEVHTVMRILEQERRMRPTGTPPVDAVVAELSSDVERWKEEARAIKSELDTVKVELLKTQQQSSKGKFSTRSIQSLSSFFSLSPVLFLSACVCMPSLMQLEQVREQLLRDNEKSIETVSCLCPLSQCTQLREALGESADSLGFEVLQGAAAAETQARKRAEDAEDRLMRVQLDTERQIQHLETRVRSLEDREAKLKRREQMMEEREHNHQMAEQKRAEEEEEEERAKSTVFGGVIPPPEEQLHAQAQPGETSNVEKEAMVALLADLEKEKDKNLRLQNDIESLKFEKEKLQKEKKNLNQKVKTLQSENEGLKKSLDSLQKEKESAQADKDAIQKENEELKAKADDSPKPPLLIPSLSREHNNAADSAEKDLEMEEMKRKIASLEEENKALVEKNKKWAGEFKKLSGTTSKMLSMVRGGGMPMAAGAGAVAASAPLGNNGPPPDSNANGGEDAPSPSPVAAEAASPSRRQRTPPTKPNDQSTTGPNDSSASAAAPASPARLPKSASRLDETPSASKKGRKKDDKPPSSERAKDSREKASKETDDSPKKETPPAPSPAAVGGGGDRSARSKPRKATRQAKSREALQSFLQEDR